MLFPAKVFDFDEMDAGLFACPLDIRLAFFFEFGTVFVHKQPESGDGIVGFSDASERDAAFKGRTELFRMDFGVSDNGEADFGVPLKSAELFA